MMVGCIGCFEGVWGGVGVEWMRGQGGSVDVIVSVEGARLRL